MAYKDLVLASGAVGLWELSQGSGTFPDLYTASPNTLTLTGTASRAQPALYPSGPSSIKFNGSASYLSATAFGSANASFSTEAIVNITTTPSVPVAICGRTDNTTFTGALNYRLIVTTNLAVSLFVFSNISTSITATSAPNVVELGKPFHVVAVFEASVGLRIFVNGAQVATTATAATGLQSGNGVFAIGAGYGPMYSTASISNLAVYTKALAALDIGQHAASVIEGVGTRITAAITPEIQYVKANCGGAGVVILPVGVISGTFGSIGAVTAPSPEVRASGRLNAPSGAMVLSCPAGFVVAYGGVNGSVSAPLQIVSAAMTGESLGTADLRAPMQAVAASGKVSGTANFSPTLGPEIGKLIGYGGSVCSVTVGCQKVSASGMSGSVGKGAVVCPLFELSGSATADNHGSASLLAPMGYLSGGAVAYIIAPMGRLTAIGTAVVTATYEAYAVNLNHTSDSPVDEVTHYTNFPFTHIVRYQNSYFGVAAGGLYLLEGTTDDGAEINYAVQTAKTDFGTPEKKTITYAYFGGRMGAEATITLVVGESGTETYSYTTPRGEAAQNYRQAFGRGVKSRYYAIKVEGGAALELDTLDLNVDQLTRRI